jgi:predicted ester cyclase
MAGQSPGTVARIVYDAYTTREFEKAAECFAPDAELLNVPTQDCFRGPHGYLQLARGWAGALPDLQITVRNFATADVTTVVEYVIRGTHTGPLVSPSGFVPPTWSRIELQFCDVLEVRDGRVERMASYFDAATMLRQMGLLPNSPLHAIDRRAALGLFATEVDSSVEQRNKAIVQRFLEEVVNQQNPGAAVATCAPDLTWHGGSIGQTGDLTSFQGALASVFASFPDLHLELHDSIAEDDRVAVRITLRGTHLGEFQGIAPTGKRVTSCGMNTYRLADSRIVEEWWQHDLLGVLRQLDALPVITHTSM